MADLTNTEKRQFERLLGMGRGYVLDFSNRTFEEFVIDSTGRNPYDTKYDHGSSKANRLRGFWAVEPNRIVGKLMGDMLEYSRTIDGGDESPGLRAQCERTVARLVQEYPVQELDALVSIGNERDFEVVATAVRDAIDRGEPEASLDRLHTFIIKYVRSLCETRGISVARDKPLHCGGPSVSARASTCSTAPHPPRWTCSSRAARRSIGRRCSDGCDCRSPRIRTASSTSIRPRTFSFRSCRGTAWEGRCPIVSGETSSGSCWYRRTVWTRNACGMAHAWRMFPDLLDRVLQVRS